MRISALIKSSSITLVVIALILGFSASLTAQTKKHLRVGQFAFGEQATLDPQNHWDFAQYALSYLLYDPSKNENINTKLKNFSFLDSKNLIADEIKIKELDILFKKITK